MKAGILRGRAIVCLALALFCSITSTWAASRNPAGSSGTVSMKTDPRAVDLGTVDCATAQLTFFVSAQIFDDGTASGMIQVTIVGGKSFLFRVISGDAEVEGRTVGDVILKLEGIGEDGVPTGVNAYAVSRPGEASEPCRIYDIAGTQFNPAIHVEATTTISVRRS